MATYNTFVVYDCKKRKPILVTSSARKANELLSVGIRIDVWNNNNKVESLYESDKRREKNPLSSYIALEKDYIQKKQEKATKRNKRRNYGLRYED